MRASVYSRYPALRPDCTRIALNIEVYPTKWYWIGEAVRYGVPLAILGALVLL